MPAGVGEAGIWLSFRAALAECRESWVPYARRQDVSVGSLARWEAEWESAKIDGTGMRLVEVEMLPMPTAERLRPAAAGVVAFKLVLPGRAHVRFFSLEGSC